MNLLLKDFIHKKDFNKERFTNLLATMSDRQFEQGFFIEAYSLNNINEDYLEKKAWGYKYSLANFPFFDISINWVLKGGYCSLHHHLHKHNRFFCLIGELDIIYLNGDGSERYVNIGPNCKNRTAFVNPKIKHFFRGLEDSIFIEVEYSMCSKDDIIRESKGGIDNDSNKA